MRFSPHGHRDRALHIDLTSMVDVVFLLIIFFLTTTQFARMTRADVELPVEPGEQQPEPDEPGIVINLLHDGSIVVDDETLDLEGLRSLIRAEITGSQRGRADKVKLMLRADRRLPAARLNQVVKLLQEMGVGLGRFATEQPR